MMSYIVYSAFVLCCVKFHLMVWNNVNAFRALGMRRPVTHRMLLFREGEVFRKCGLSPVRAAEQQLLKVMSVQVHTACVEKKKTHTACLFNNI